MLDNEGFDGRTGEVIEHRNLPASPQGERNLIFTSPECSELFGALAEAQGEMSNPKKTKTAKVQGTTKNGASYSYDYQYAPLEEVVDVIRAPMAKAGLIHRQFLATREGNYVMRTIVAHRSGQWYGCDYPIFVDRPGAQGFASGVTYARRYGLMLALGLVGEDDDDANVADGNEAKITTAAKAPQAPRRSPPAREMAQQPTDALEDAKRRHAEIVETIKAAQTPADIDVILNGKDWSQLIEVGTKADGEENCARVMGLLRTRAEKRREELGGPPDAESGPALVATGKKAPPPRAAAPEHAKPAGQERLGVGIPAQEGKMVAERSYELPPVMVRGESNWHIWVVSLLLPEIRKTENRDDMAGLLEANDNHLVAARKAIDAADLKELDAAITKRWDEIFAAEESAS